MNDKIFFWQVVVEHHHIYTWLEVQKKLATKPTFIVKTLENKIRKAQGWKSSNLDQIDYMQISEKDLKEKGKEIIKNNREAIHVFLGFRGHIKYDYFGLIVYGLKIGAKIVVLNEAYSISPTGYYGDTQPILDRVKPLIRPLLYSWMAYVINQTRKKHDLCIFALSILAQDQFIKAGFKSDGIYPFGYFVPKMGNIKNHNHKSSQDEIKLVYVGTWIKRKGLDILLPAIASLRQQGFNVTLDLYGHNPSQKKSKSDQGTTHKGLLEFEKVQETIANYDILVLPSRHDGWGVVVNEALLQGVPVIASNCVGAKCLIEASEAGMIFESENQKDLEEKIKQLVQKNGLLEKLMENASHIGENISPQTAAQYFIEILDHHFHKNTYLPTSYLWQKKSLTRKF